MRMESPQLPQAAAAAASVSVATSDAKPAPPSAVARHAASEKFIAAELDLVHGLSEKLAHEDTTLFFITLLLANAALLPWSAGAANPLLGAFAWFAASTLFGVVVGVVSSRLSKGNASASGLAAFYSLQAGLAAFFASSAIFAFIASQSVFSSVPALAVIFWTAVAAVSLFGGMKTFLFFERHAGITEGLPRLAASWLAGLAIVGLFGLMAWGAVFG